MKAGFAARAPIRIRFMLTAMKNKHVQQEVGREEIRAPPKTPAWEAKQEEAAWPID